jgi:hypothetical protein
MGYALYGQHTYEKADQFTVTFTVTDDVSGVTWNSLDWAWAQIVFNVRES